MKRLLLPASAGALILSAVLGAGAALAESHTPVVVCHWVPAGPAGSHMIPGPDGGSYVVIVVDDDAATGNKNGKGHAGHGDDIFGDPGCGLVD